MTLLVPSRIFFFSACNYEVVEEIRKTSLLERLFYKKEPTEKKYLIVEWNKDRSIDDTPGFLYKSYSKVDGRFSFYFAGESGSNLFHRVYFDNPEEPKLIIQQAQEFRTLAL